MSKELAPLMQWIYEVSRVVSGECGGNTTAQTLSYFMNSAPALSQAMTLVLGQQLDNLEGAMNFGPWSISTPY